jgi:Putative prokaryotic signal transducing protein
LSAVRREGQGAESQEDRDMKELLRSNDPVLLSFVSSLLTEAEIGFIVLDTNMSVMEGSIGILPRRVLVEENCIDSARNLLTEAGVGHDLDRENKT